MHASALTLFEKQLFTVKDRVLEASHRSFIRVLDIGGQDVNGNVYEVLDRVLGTGFGTVGCIDVLDIDPSATAVRGTLLTLDVMSEDMTEFVHGLPGDATYDLVISTETAEHVGPYPDSLYRLSEAAALLGASFVGTAAGLGRPPHGGRGEFPLPADEHYHNVDQGDLEHALSLCWLQAGVERSGVDISWWATQ